MFLRVLALAIVAITLVPSAAHLFELPGKIDLERDAYFTVQTIYAGWALFAIPIFAAILVNVGLFFSMRRHDRTGAAFALISASLVVISLAIFFAWVFPANQATANWTTIPDNWQTLRRDWEYGHAVNAAIVFAAFVATSVAASRRRT